jgi:hypothetical protein
MKQRSFKKLMLSWPGNSMLLRKHTVHYRIQKNPPLEFFGSILILFFPLYLSLRRVVSSIQILKTKMLHIFFIFQCVTWPVKFTVFVFVWPLFDLGPFLSSLIFLHSRYDFLGRGNQPLARPLSEHRTAQTQKKRTQTSILQVGFELTIPMFERAKTVYALDRLATVIGVP